MQGTCFQLLVDEDVDEQLCHVTCSCSISKMTNEMFQSRSLPSALLLLWPVACTWPGQGKNFLSQTEWNYLVVLATFQSTKWREEQVARP